MCKVMWPTFQSSKHWLLLTFLDEYSQNEYKQSIILTANRFGTVLFYSEMIKFVSLVVEFNWLKATGMHTQTRIYSDAKQFPAHYKNIHITITVWLSLYQQG